MSSRTVTTDYLVTTTFEVLRTFRSESEAHAYATTVRRAGFLTTAELDSLRIETKGANR